MHFALGNEMVSSTRYRIRGLLNMYYMKCHQFVRYKGQSLGIRVTVRLHVAC
jgi:hypothetical protein